MDMQLKQTYQMRGRLYLCSRLRGGVKSLCRMIHSSQKTTIYYLIAYKLLFKTTAEKIITTVFQFNTYHFIYFKTKCFATLQ